MIAYLDDIPNKVKNILGIIVDVNYKRHSSKEYIEIKVDPQIYPIIQNQFNGIQVKFQSEIDWQKDNDKNRMAMNDIHHKKLENTRDKIVRLISKSPDISSRKIADILGLTKKAVEWQIKRLKNDGIIKRVGPPKGGKWVIISQNILDEHV